MKSNKVLNLGCRLNSYESTLIEQVLDKNSTKNITVVNTCSVTNQALKKSLLAVKKLAKSNPENRIFVTGCASEIYPEIFKKIKSVDRIISNKNKTNKDFYKSPSTLKKLHESHTSYIFPTPSKKLSGRTRALLQIQQGCDHSCTFCIIPSGRGESISLPLGGIMQNISKYIDWGYQEVVLTGVDITSYGNDLPGKPRLGNVIKRILKLQPKLKRIRLSSLDPAEIDEDLLEVIKFDNRVLPHVHFSVQSGDDLILKRMKRRHSTSQLLELCDQIKKARPSITFGADLIIGFPTETKQNFLNTCDLLHTGFFSNLHIFPFSPMERTPASRMPQVKSDIIQKRTEDIRKLGDFFKRKLMQKKINKTAKILFENQKLSYTNDYFKVRIKNFSEEQSIQEHKGKLIDIKLLSVENDFFNGEII